MLKIDRIPKHLSPSALLSSDQPHTFYLERLCEQRLPRKPQSFPAAIGSAFDVEIKKFLLDQGISKNRKEEISNTFESSVEQYKEEAYKIAKKVLPEYVTNLTTKFTEIEKRILFVKEDVPILSYLDAVCVDEQNERMPFDWKCMGLNPNNKTFSSPKASYYIQFNANGVSKFAHKKFYTDIPFEQIFRKWAVQLCTYGWAIGLKGEFRARIDCITNSKKGYLFTEYKGLITESFQAEVMAKYKLLWKDLHNDNFINRLKIKTCPSDVFMFASQESWF